MVDISQQVPTVNLTLIAYLSIIFNIPLFICHLWSDLVEDTINWEPETKCKPKCSLLEQSSGMEGKNKSQDSKREEQPNNKTGNDMAIDTATGWLPPSL